MKPLTTRQSEILFAIYTYRDAHGVPPTHQALSEVLGITRYAARSALEALANKGHIELRGGIVLPPTRNLLEKRHA